MRSTQFEEPEHSNKAAQVRLSGAALAAKPKKRSSGAKPQKPAK